MRISAACLAALLLGACTMAVHGEDAFRAQAERQTATAQRPLEQVYKCFLDKGINPGAQQLYPESGLATWSFTPGITYIAQAEFRRLTPTSTEVTLWALRGGDPTVRPETLWSGRVAPCMG